jgi:DNA-binding transcriptional ArsR family regulator
VTRDLRQRIADALSGHVDPELFEQCSWDLLLPVYPGLAPIPGGYDFGRDADIHAGYGTARLLATTASDVRRNMTKSLDSLKAAGLDTAHLVVATNQRLSGRRLAGLTALARKRGVARVDVFEREAWVSRLYHDPRWRLRLLGLGGEPTAIVDVPLELDLSGGRSVPLLGRTDELNRLLSERADWVILGVAGCGKTRLVAELPGVGFVIDAPITAIADDVRTGGYEYLVVDDADRRAGLLRALVELRRSEALSFRLIGTTWPEHVTSLGDELVKSERLELPLLERGEVDAISTSVGVTSYYVRRDILEQAEGRPGWAFALARMARDGDVASLTSGRGLMDEVERFLRRSGLATALGLIAHVAILGSLEPEEYGQLAAYLGVPRLTLEEQISRLTRAGLAESVRGELAVRPEALRQALVAHWFFADEIPRSIEDVLSSWPSHADEVIRSTIQAAGLGAPGARTKTLQLIKQRKLSRPNLRHAAAIDESVARAVIDGTPASSAMRDIYEVAARRYALSGAVKALLDLGMSDDRPRHSHPDHPLRIVSEIGTRLYPHELTSFEARTRVLGAAIEWGEESGTPAAWSAFAEVVGSVLNPQVEGNWPELQEASKFTMAAGFESAANLAAIEKEYWPRVAPLLSEMPDESVALLADLLDAWIRVARGFQGPFGVTPSASAVAVAARLARRMKRDFATRAGGRPGLSVRLKSIGRLLKSPIRVDGPVPVEFSALSNDILGHRDFARAEREQAALLGTLAASWKLEAPQAVVGRLLKWQREALIARTPLDAAVAFTIHRTLELGAPPGPWAEAIVQAGLCSAGSPAIDRVLREATSVPAWFSTAMRGPCRGVVVNSVLSRPPSNITAAVVGQLEQGDADAVEWAVKRRKSPDETCRLLLVHGDPSVSGAAALAFRLPGKRHGPQLPDEWLDDWAAAITSIDIGLHGAHRDYEVREMLEALVSTGPDIAEAWVRNALKKSKYAIGALPYDAEEYLHRLPRENRDRLLRSVSGSWNRSQVLETLLGDDVEWAEQLIIDQAASAKEVLDALAGRVGPSLESFLPLLLKHGISPSEAASRAHLERVWVGSESSRYAELRDYFGTLAASGDPSIAAVGSAGMDLFSRAYETAIQEEKAERVRGL